MVSSVRFRGWYVLYLLVLGWEGVAHKHNSHSGWHTQWVCHSGPQGGPHGGLCYPPHSPFLHGFHISCLVHGLNGIWCSFHGGGDWYVLILLVLGWASLKILHHPLKRTESTWTLPWCTHASWWDVPCSLVFSYWKALEWLRGRRIVFEQYTIIELA